MSPPVRGRRRPDIEGLRAVAALLIAVYHIWFGTVSGGVDVFLLLTGFLITGSLVRAMERDGRIALGAFWSKLVRRLFPAGAVVLGAVLVGAHLLLPRSRWTDVIAEVRAAALYHLNWHLAGDSVDYLAQNNAASPVQHFWSLAVQGQFYLLWPLLVTLAGLVAVRLGASVRRAALAAVAAVLAVSFGYSLWITAHEPVWAYFDAGARLWELALGGVLALVIHRVRPPRWLRLAAGWLGLTALVACGVVIGDALPYPGYASLWPTLAAALVIVGGANGADGWSANRLLGWRPLTWLGGHAFPLFLWHWPVLVFHLEVTDSERPTLAGGFLVLGVSFAAALLTSWIIDGGLARATTRFSTPIWSLAAGVVFVVPVLVAAGLWSGSIEHERRLRLELSANPAAYPGAAVHLDPALADTLPVLPVHPDTSTVIQDTVDRTRGCIASSSSTELVSCEFGDTDSDYTIAMVGSSHVRHWVHGLRALAEHHGWRLVLITKNSCQFTTETQYRRNGDAFPECNDWNGQVMDELAELRPDAVFGLATLTARGKGEGEEHVPDGFVERWRQLDAMGIDVVAVRDTPRFPFRVPECLDRNHRADCVMDQYTSMAEVAPYGGLTGVPGNTRFVDMTDYLCTEGVCPGVIGNHVVYYDTNHFSYAFSQSLAVVMEPSLFRSLPHAPASQDTLAESTGSLLAAE
ncbi:acyltransferase family protein [Nocardiopsis sp. FR6]|uniref:acyltransferase family protein n=1 Tax=Nocardiopsis sp. FR6 TaxID=2605986 RepID=UPI001359685D|nr:MULTISPECIES: acyltransferase family protein [unclassified Nocardiopsis]